MGGIQVGVADNGVSGAAFNFRFIPLLVLLFRRVFSGDETLRDREDLDDLLFSGDEELRDLDGDSRFE